MPRLLRFLLVTCFLCLLFGGRDARAQAVDLALVLVIDNSGSIDPAESALQFNGYAEAFRSPELVKEMTGGPNGAIAVSVLLFSDVVRSLGGWRIIDGAASANAFANLLRSAPYSSSGGTHIAQALEAAVMELASCPYPSAAATIDLSGDGPDNEGVAINIANPIELLLAFTGLQTAQWNQEIQNNAYRLRRLRDSIRARGVSINCVAIQDPALQDYFEKYVVCGKGSFAMLASSFQSFRTVIKRKILREVRAGVQQSVQKSAKRPPKPATKPKNLQGKENRRKNEAKTEPKDETKGAAEATGKDGSATQDTRDATAARDQFAVAASPQRHRKEAVVTVLDAESKLPLSEAEIALVAGGENFASEANGSLPGQFAFALEAVEGASISLRVDAPGYTPAEIKIDLKGRDRYEVQLQRRPIEFVL